MPAMPERLQNLLILAGSKVQDIYLEDECNLAKSFVSAVSAIPVLEIYFKKTIYKVVQSLATGKNKYMVHRPLS